MNEATAVPAQEHFLFKQPSDRSTPLVLRRDSGLMQSACSSRFYVNGSHAANISSGERVTLHVPSGDVILGAQQGGICAGGLVEIQVKLSPGSPAHYRIGFDHNGSLGLFPTATR
jgi:hypothetical protein